MRPPLLFVAIVVSGLLAQLAPSAPAAAAAATGFDEPIKPVPPAASQDPARVALGRSLFVDRRLSANSSVSCASCHDLRKGGAGSTARSTGLNGVLTVVNTPTVFNAALNFRQFWDGRAESLEAQIDEVVRNAGEMGSKWDDVVAKVAGDRDYAAAFARTYRDGVTKANIQNALASFERTLVTPDARFDRYLRGERDAITEEERSGYAKFKQYGCIACHQGVNIGGNMFQKFGVMAEVVRHGPSTEADLGRFAITHDEADMHVFKVPSLRNVAMTAPYFHDGSAATLEDAVDVMFRVQLGRRASRQDKQDIVRFLGTLTGANVARP